MDEFEYVYVTVKDKFKNKLRNILTEDKMISIDDIINHCYCECHSTNDFSEDSIKKALNGMRKVSRKQKHFMLNHEITSDQVPVFNHENVEYDERVSDANKLNLTEEECLAIMYARDKNVKRDKSLDFKFMNKKGGNLRGIDYIKTCNIYAEIINKLVDHIKYELS